MFQIASELAKHSLKQANRVFPSQANFERAIIATNLKFHPSFKFLWNQVVWLYKSANPKLARDCSANVP